MPELILFDETCTSTGKKHEGTITLPDGETMPAQLTSFAGSHEGKPFLVMALPSVWRSGENAVYAEFEDVFLMMEGAANWAAMQHVAREMPQSEAVESIRGRRQRWTQDEGLGIFLAIDAALPGWQSMVMGDHPPSLEALIERATAGR